MFAAAALCLLGTSAAAETFAVEGASAIWQSANLRRVESPAPVSGQAPLAEIAYDRHFVDTGLPPEWPFLQRLREPSAGAARIEGGEVVFPASGVRRPLPTAGIPDVATPAEPFLLAAPAAKRIIAVAPYYLFRDKETRYAAALYTEAGEPAGTFDSLPTFALAGTGDVLVSPQRTGCCETTAWTLTFYDLAAASVATYGCPPGQCGDFLLAGLEGGRLLVGTEEFETHLGEGAVVVTKLAVVSPRGPAEASATLVHARRDPQAGLSSDGACATRLLVAERSPYALKNLVSVTRSRDGGWEARFTTPGGPETWGFSGVPAVAAPAVSFPVRH